MTARTESKAEGMVNVPSFGFLTTLYVFYGTCNDEKSVIYQFIKI